MEMSQYTRVASSLLVVVDMLHLRTFGHIVQRYRAQTWPPCDLKVDNKREDMATFVYDF